MSTLKNIVALLSNLEGMPIQIPREILKNQIVLGPTPTLVWINLLAHSQLGLPFQEDKFAETMGLEQRELSHALALLASAGWISDETLEIKLSIPSDFKEDRTEVPVLDIIEQGSILSPEQAGFEWLVDYWSARVATPSHDEMRKMLHWMERRGLSHEVIAVGIEEMCESVAFPNFPYLEGILRNWHRQGIRTYNDLLDNPHLTKVLKTVEGGSELTPAQKRWKEVFPDEFD